MAVQFFSGFETGDASEWTTVSGSWSVQTTTVNSGNYAVSSSTIPGTLRGVLSSTQTTVFVRFYVRFHGLTASLSGTDLRFFSLADSTGATSMCQLFVTTDASSNPSIQLTNGASGSAVNVGSAYAVAKDTWVLVEVKCVISATVGILELRVNGSIAATGSNLNTGTAAVGRASLTLANDSGLHSPAGTIYYDDVFVNNSSYIGAGGCIARQFNATTPNYNTFTKVGGTNIQDVWDNTPFTTGTNATDAVSSGKQTGVPNFANTSDTGATGHGTGYVLSNDVINAAKIGAVAKTGTASDAADSTIFRTPAGGSGSDTTTAFSAGWGTADGYLETILATTPTASQILNCEAGIQHNATTNTHTYEDVWIMIDYVPIRPVVPRHLRHFVRKQISVSLKSSQPRVQIRLIQPPAAKLGFMPRQVRSRIAHRVPLPQRTQLVKSSFRRLLKGTIQPPAFKLGFMPRQVRSRISHALKPGPKWKSIKSSFPRILQRLIQPPAAKLGVPIRRLIRARLLKLKPAFPPKHDEQNIERHLPAPGAFVRRIKNKLLRLKPAPQLKHDEQDIPKRLPAPTSAVFVRRQRRIMVRRAKRPSELRISALSGRPAIAAAFKPLFRKARAVRLVAQRRLRRAKLLAGVPIAFRRVVTHARSRVFKLAPRVRLRIPQKLIQPPAAALGAALREIVRKAHPVRLGKPWRSVKSSFKKVWLTQPPSGRLGFPVSKLRDTHRLLLRKPSVFVKSTLRIPRRWIQAAVVISPASFARRHKISLVKASRLVRDTFRAPRRIIQPPAAQLGAALREIIRKPHPVGLGKRWKTIKSSFRIARLQKPALAALLGMTPGKLRKAHRLVLQKPVRLVKSSFKRPTWLIQPPAAKLAFAVTRVAKRHIVRLRAASRQVKDTFRAPQRIIQPPAAKLGFPPTKLTVRHRLLSAKPLKLVKSALRIPRRFIQPPAARLGIALREIIRKPHPIARGKSWRSIKSSFKVFRMQQSALAARLAFVPTKTRRAHTVVLRKASGLIKSTLRAPQRIIQPPAARLGFPPTRMASRRKTKAKPATRARYRIVRLFAQPLVAVRLMRRAARPIRVRRAHFAAGHRVFAQPLAIFRIIHRVRRVQAVHQPRQRRSPRFSFLVGLLILRHLRRVRPVRRLARARSRILPAFQPRVPAAWIRLRVHRLRTANRSPAAARQHQPQRIAAVSGIRAFFIRLRFPKRPAFVRRLIRRARHFRWFPKPLIPANAPRVVIFEARLDRQVTILATLDRQAPVTATLDRQKQIDARLDRVVVMEARLDRVIVIKEAKI